jgi:hypothetical protein
MQIMQSRRDFLADLSGAGAARSGLATIAGARQALVGALTSPPRLQHALGALHHISRTATGLSRHSNCSMIQSGAGGPAGVPIRLIDLTGTRVGRERAVSEGDCSQVHRPWT